jgi:hypothetical protein
MTARDFHNAVLKGGRIPLEFLRAHLSGETLRPEFKSIWNNAASGEINRKLSNLGCGSVEMPREIPDAETLGQGDGDFRVVHEA